MADELSRNRLGRGLAALIGDMESETSVVDRARGQRFAEIAQLAPNANNPRRNFAEDELADLSASIAQKGIVQPILVRPRPQGDVEFEIIAGERRWRAAQKAGLHSVPVVIRDVSDSEAIELALVENIQRSDLNPLEEAAGYQRLIEQFNYSQSEMAQVIGKSRSHVANTLRLLKLPDEVRTMISDGLLTAGHARAVITADDPIALARAIVAAGLSVRDTENLAKAPRGQTGGGAKRSKSADTIALEKRLSDGLGLTVRITDKAGAGSLTVSYRNLEQLDEICRKLTGE
jgi:ParB family chromosome partitioning protein